MNETTGFDVPNEWPDVYACIAELELNDGNFELAVELANKGLAYRDEKEGEPAAIYYRVETVLGASLGQQGKFHEAADVHAAMAETAKSYGRTSKSYRNS